MKRKSKRQTKKSNTMTVKRGFEIHYFVIEGWDRDGKNIYWEGEIVEGSITENGHCRLIG